MLIACATGGFQIREMFYVDLVFFCDFVWNVCYNGLKLIKEN